MANIRPPTGGPPRPAAPRPSEPSVGPGRPAAASARPAAARPPSTAAKPTAADAFRAESAAPVTRLRQADPATRAPASSDRTQRRSDVLARATGGALEAFDPAAERTEEPIEANTAIRDPAGRLLTPHIDAWMRVIDAGGVEPPFARGVASELGGVAEADAMAYAATLHRATGRPLGALLGALGKIELKSFLRLLAPDAREGLVGGWASGFAARVARQRDEVGRIAKELGAVTTAHPRSFKKVLEKADPGALRTVVGSMGQQERQELFGLVPQKLLGNAASVLGQLAPAAVKSAPSREAQDRSERPKSELALRLSTVIEKAVAGAMPEPGSSEVAELESSLGLTLLSGGVQGWQEVGVALGEAKELGFRGRGAAALILRCALEGLRAAVRKAPETGGAALQIPFALAGKLDGVAGSVFTALGRHCMEDFNVYVDGRGLWRQLVSDAVGALRAEAGDSEAARAWIESTTR